jgi:predicted outer membrane repeat protein
MMNPRLSVFRLSFVGILAIGLGHSAQAAIWYVDASAPTTGQTGSITNPYVTIQQAITASTADLNPPDEIRVGWASNSTPMVYKPGGQLLSIELRSGVRVKGGYLGWTGSTFDTTRDPDIYETILTGNLGGGVFARHVVTSPSGCAPPSSSGSVTDRVNLDGFTIKDGVAVDNGGGILINGSTNTAVFRDCIITNNTAPEGGGVFAEGGTNTVFRKCRFISNTADGGGAASANGAGAFTFTDCTFDSNVAEFQGGAFNGNSRSVGVNYINCTFKNNEVADLLGPGGAIYLTGATNITLPVYNCLFVHNRASSGGAIYVQGSSGLTVNATNCTFSENEADSQGGALYAGAVSSTCNVNVKNSIFWNDSATTSPEIHVSSATVSVYYSNVEGGWSGPGGNNLSGNPSTDDPNFVNPSGPNGDYRLDCPSPCFEKGEGSYVLCDQFDVDEDALNCTSTPTELWPDLDLNLRIAAVVDLGAYERPWDRCELDISGPTVGQPDGDIGVPDLLYLIANWGCTTCGIDFAPIPCGNNGNVGVGELLAIINYWGSDCATEDSIPVPATITDCFEVYCAGLSGAAWEDCINKCVEAVCAENPSECE